MMMNDTQHNKTLEISRHITEIPVAAYQANTASYVDMRQASQLTSVAERAFFLCHLLLHIYFAPNLRVLGPAAFKECEKLQTVELKDNQNLQEIGPSAFDGCVSLMYMILPRTTTTIGEGAFANCVKLMTVKLPLHLKVIPRKAFKNCHQLQGINLESTMVSTVGEEAFENCAKLREIGIPRSLEEIARHAFLGCTNLVHVRHLSRAVRLKTIGEGAFHGCKLTDVAIPCSVDNLMEDAFDAVSLKRIEVNGNRHALSLRLSRMYPKAYVGMPMDKWCHLHCHDGAQVLSTLRHQGDKEKLDEVKRVVPKSHV